MCEFLIQKKALTFYSQSLICHCNALVLLSFIILPYKTSALFPGVFIKEYKKSCRWQPLVYYFIIIESSLTYDRRILLHAPHPDHPDE